jgi:hypothetical protein
MTPQEKAKELVNKFYPRATSYSLDRKNQNQNAKQCALIAVDEIIESRKDDSRFDDTLFQITTHYITPHPMYLTYWQEVKQEINLL